MMKALVTIFNMSISRHDGICLMSSFADQSEVRLWATCSRSHVQSVSCKELSILDLYVQCFAQLGTFEKFCPSHGFSLHSAALKTSWPSFKIRRLSFNVLRFCLMRSPSAAYLAMFPSFISSTTTADSILPSRS